MEEWKDIKNYEGLYQVSNLGRVLTSGGKALRDGIGYRKNRNKWVARIRINGKEKHLGSYSTEFEAKNAYDNFKINNDLLFVTKPIKILKLNVTAGYARVALAKNNIITHCFVHKLVAETFIPNPDNKSQVNHKNLNVLDNRVCNLEWLTASENMIHAHSNKQLGVGKETINLDTGMKFTSIFKASEWINSKYGNVKQIKTIACRISRCCRGFSKIAYGYRWKNT